MWRDWALVAAVVILAVIEALVHVHVPSRWILMTVVIGLSPTLLWRRTKPLLMVLIAFTVSGIVPWIVPGHPPDLYVTASFLLLPYALFRWGTGREAVVGLAVLVGCAAFSFLTRESSVSDVIGGSVVIVATAAIATSVRYRHRLRLRELEEVRLLEREQLARDLHDTVAHHFSAIAIRAQAGLAVADHAPEALRLIDAEASRALAEMRAIVRVLRHGPAELAPNPGIPDLSTLSGHAGPPVEVRLEGDFDALSPAVGAAIYRIAQESVTNARRHARHATRIDVSVCADERSIRLNVSDDGEPGPAAPPGLGLTGMMERVALLGGTCTAGPSRDRGWTVSAVLPRIGAAQ